MNMTRRHALAAGMGGAFSALSLSSLYAEFDGPVMRTVEGGEEFWLATDAYIYGYPLVTMCRPQRSKATPPIRSRSIIVPISALVRLVPQQAL